MDLDSSEVSFNHSESTVLPFTLQSGRKPTCYGPSVSYLRLDSTSALGQRHTLASLLLSKNA